MLGRAFGCDDGQTCVPQAVDIRGVDGAMSLAVGPYVACAVLKTGAVACWELRLPLKASAVPELSHAVGVAVQRDYGCAIVRSAGELGSVWCWGWDYYGGVGKNSIPFRVSQLPGNVTDTAMGWTHGCALVTAAPTAMSSVGAKTTTPSLAKATTMRKKNSAAEWIGTATKVPGLGRARALYAGADNTCAVTESRQVLCWGLNGVSQLPVDPDALQVVVEGLYTTVLLPAILTGVCV